jgi:hypothetical protein
MHLNGLETIYIYNDVYFIYAAGWTRVLNTRVQLDACILHVSNWTRVFYTCLDRRAYEIHVSIFCHVFFIHVAKCYFFFQIFIK